MAGKMKRKGNGGFTLVELLVVVGLMVLVTSIVTTGAFGLSRGASFTSSKSTVSSMLEYARQKACIDGKDVVVCFYEYERPGGNYYSMGLFQRAGVVTRIAGNTIADRYNTFSSDVENHEICNIGNGKVAKVVSYNNNSSREVPLSWLKDSGGNQVKVTYSEAQFTLSSAQGFREGDGYGFALSDRKDFPKGFGMRFDSMPYSGGGGAARTRSFVFRPDGSVDGGARFAAVEAATGKSVLFEVKSDGSFTEK